MSSLNSFFMFRSALFVLNSKALSLSFEIPTNSIS
jgi:hypothetical protein